MSVKTQLVEEIQKEIEELRKLELGSEKYKVTADGITKLMDRAIEIDKIDGELKKRETEREFEEALKLQMLNDEKKDRLIRNIIEGVKIGGGLGLAAWAFVASMNFEKEGTLTTEGGRNALRQLLRFVR